MNMKNWLILLLLVSALPLHAGVNSQLRQSGKLYSQKKYGQAFANYNEILQETPQNEQAAFGAGASAYYLKDYPAAAHAFEQVVKQQGLRSQDALFNLGNTYYRAGQKEKAISAYRQAILKNPQDKEAIHNLQLLLQEQNQSNNQNNQNNQNSDSNSSNQGQGPQDNPAGSRPDNPEASDKTPSPQEQQNQQAEKEAAQRVLQLARENEQKPTQKAYASSENSVEKDW